MKKFIFGIIAAFIAVAACMPLGKKGAASADREQNGLKKGAADSALLSVAGMVWKLGMENSVDVQDSNALNRWQEECEKAMVAYYDLLHPHDSLKEFNKVEAVLDAVEKRIPEGMTTIDMVNQTLMDYSMLMFRKTAYAKRVAEGDSCFVRECQAWKELEGQLSKFCTSVAESEWAGGSACNLMMSAARNSVLKARVRDLQRILQLEGGTDPASDGMVDYKKQALLRAIVKAPMKAPDELFAALDRWIENRGRYKGCTAIALDDMADAVWHTYS